ncbi:MAG: helix-turn-helix domain-containing protein [Fimbriimonadaceae bacterium]
MNESSDVVESMIITDLERVRMIANPLRQSIVAAFRGAPKTTKQVAALLGIKGNRLYHHVEMLERAGFLELVEARPNRGTVERFLRATADRFVAQLGSVSEGTEVVKEAFDEALKQIETLSAEGCPRPMLLQGGITLREGEQAEFESKLIELIRQYKTESRATHSIVMAVYPVRETDA